MLTPGLVVLFFLVVYTLMVWVTLTRYGVSELRVKKMMLYGVAPHVIMMLFLWLGLEGEKHYSWLGVFLVLAITIIALLIPASIFLVIMNVFRKAKN